MCQKREADLKLFEENPFNTLCHGDFWVNNMMIGYEKGNDQPKAMKIIDFQFIKFGTLAEDVIFFLFTSVGHCAFPSKIDHLLDVYYKSFRDYLEIHGCPLEDYSKER